jgi:hypothetical protein
MARAYLERVLAGLPTDLGAPPKVKKILTRYVFIYCMLSLFLGQIIACNPNKF